MKNLFLILILCSAFLALPALAAIDSYTLLEPLPCIDNTGQQCTNGLITKVNLAGYLGYVFRLVIALAGAIAVFRITWGGFRYMTTDAVTGKKEGKEEVKQAIYGLVMILASYLILRTVDPRLVSLTTELPPLRNTAIDFDAAFASLYQGSMTAQRLAELKAVNQEYNSLLKTANQKLEEASKLDENSEERVRLEADALALEQKAAKLRADNVILNKYNVIEASLSTAVISPGTTFPTITPETKTRIEAQLSDLLKAGTDAARELEAKGDTAGGQTIRHQTTSYFKKERDQLMFLERFVAIQKKTMQSTPDKKLAVKDGDAFILELKSAQQAAPTSIKDAKIRELYIAQINDQISQLTALIAPYRNIK